MFKQVSSTHAVIDKSTAERMLKTTNVLDGQRKIKKLLIYDYKDRILEGKFLSSIISIAHNKENGQEILVDGQHRLTAVADHNLTIDVTIHKYDCDDLADVVDLYHQFNTDAKRTLADFTTVESAHLKVAWNGTVGRWVVNYGTMMHYQSFNSTPGQEHVSAKTGRMSSHIDAGNFAQNIYNLHLTKKHNNGFLVLGIGFCILHSYEHHDRDVASAFWDTVLAQGNLVDGVIVTDKNAARVFRNTINTAQLSRQTSWWGSDQAARRRIAIYYQTAFDHFKKGNEIKYLTYSPNRSFKWGNGKP